MNLTRSGNLMAFEKKYVLEQDTRNDVRDVFAKYNSILYLNLSFHSITLLDQKDVDHVDRYHQKIYFVQNLKLTTRNTRRVIQIFTYDRLMRFPEFDPKMIRYRDRG